MHMLFHNTKTKPFKPFALSLLLTALLLNNAFAQTGTLPDSASTDGSEPEQVQDSVVAGTSAMNTIEPLNKFSLRMVPDSVANKLKNSREFEYANDPGYLKKKPVKYDKGFWDYFLGLVTSKGARLFAYILIFAILIFAFYRIVVDNKLYLFYSEPKKLNVAGADEHHLSKEDIDEKILESLQAKNYRLAIRYMHLKTLKLLDESKLIRFHAQSTNHEYAFQLGDTRFGKDFRHLSNIYECAWYGGFDISEPQAIAIRQNFEQFYSLLKK